jgi:hypothetical protein
MIRMTRCGSRLNMHAENYLWVCAKPVLIDHNVACDSKQKKRDNVEAPASTEPVFVYGLTVPQRIIVAVTETGHVVTLARGWHTSTDFLKTVMRQLPSAQVTGQALEHTTLLFLLDRMALPKGLTGEGFCALWERSPTRLAGLGNGEPELLVVNHRGNGGGGGSYCCYCGGGDGSGDGSGNGGARSYRDGGDEGGGGSIGGSVGGNERGSQQQLRFSDV